MRDLVPQIVRDGTPGIIKANHHFGYTLPPLTRNRLSHLMEPYNMQALQSLMDGATAMLIVEPIIVPKLRKAAGKKSLTDAKGCH